MSERDELAFWTKTLSLPDFVVVHVRRDRPEDPLRLTVRPALEAALCPHCQKASDEVHRTLESAVVKDLPIGPQEVELLVRTPQFHCAHCDRFFTPDYRAFAPGAHATERFLERAAKLIRVSDVKNAADFFGLPQSTLERWYYDYVRRQQQAPPVPLKPIRSIGIDELSQKKSTASSSP